ncbi:MAG: hypothetical protein MJ146_00225 [Clostridia bacterium]|nr:hypothetical protein [Clostridia bacterium]
MSNDKRLGILKNSILATLGLMLFGLGTYLMIQSDIGVEPWACFALGLSKKLGILYGNASILISVIIICMDLLLKEKIGIGTILDAVVVGKTVDLLNWIDLIPKPDTLWVSIVMILISFVIFATAQYIYMKAQLCCGPRDAFQVALGKRMPKIPIGIVNVFILSTVFILAWLLDGPIGICTVIAPIGIGLMQQVVFTLAKFDPKAMNHQSIIQSFIILFKKE